MRRVSILLLLLMSRPGMTVPPDSNRAAQGLSGTYVDPFAGWQPDGRGRWTGTGSNFGSGFTRSPDGTIRGTGNRFGEVWIPAPGGQGYIRQGVPFNPR